MTDVTIIGALVNKNFLSRVKLYDSTFSYHIREQHDLQFMETGFAADGFNYDVDYFMFVSGYLKCVYALVCSEL